MKETPMIFSTEHIPELLDGSKTMTRRTTGLGKINKELDKWVLSGKDLFHHWLGDTTAFIFHHKDTQEERIIKCPYGQVGDRLWVRETFVIESDINYGYSEEELARWSKDRPIKTEDGGYEWGQYHLIPHYRATELEPNIVPESADDFDDKTRWSPSIHMPRWASRITLEIIEVRVERVQEISHQDACKEGCKATMDEFQPGASYMVEDYREHFIRLWDSLYAKKGYGWEANPWVWVISFKKGELNG